MGGGGHVQPFEGPQLHDRGGGPRPVPAAALRPAALPSEGRHARGLKPGKILCDAEMNIKIMDFGLSSVTRVANLTPSVAAPLTLPQNSSWGRAMTALWWTCGVWE